MTAAKQVVYVDVDDEITAVIDKINEADARVVALVLPKRASVFQSIVNMKLLKRRAEQANKHLVLITSEASLMPLAGLAGMYVASTLQSKPEIPSSPVSSDLPEDVDEDAVLNDGFDPAQNADVPVGALAGSTPAGVNDLPDDMQELDKAPAVSGTAGSGAGRPSPELAAIAASGAAKAAPKTPKDKKLKVPNFLKFRKRLVLAVLALVALVGLWYVAWFIMPTASVSIKTKTADIDAAFNVTLDTAATAVDAKDLVVPAKSEQQKKENTQQAPATGQENKGNKATGTITLTNCNKDNLPVTIPAGTGVSANGLTFLTQSSITLPTSAPDSNGTCRSFGGLTSGDVVVVAQKAGAPYNLAPSKFAIAGFDSVEGKSESPMNGGTDNIVKVVQQGDIDAAKAKIANDNEKDTVSKELQKKLEDSNYFAIKSTLHAEAGDVVTSTKVGEQAEAVTVSQSITYTMYGARKADLRKLVEAEVADKIDKDKQSIIDDGISSAKFTPEKTASSSPLKMAMAVTAVAGPQLDVEQVKQNMVGKKSGVVKDEIKTYPGVEDVTVKYSPFWVTKAPKPAKTTIVFEKSDSAGQSDDQTNNSDSTEQDKPAGSSNE